MRLRYVAILIAGISSLAVAGAVVADGMPAKTGKAHPAAKAKKKSTHAYGQGLHDESWDIANELNRQEWMRHRYGEDRDFGADGQEDENGGPDGGVVSRERHDDFDGGRDYAMDHRHFGHRAPPPLPVEEEPLPPVADLPPPPVADLPPPRRAPLPPAPHFEEPAPAPADRYAHRGGHEHRAEGGMMHQRRAQVRVYRDSHSASEERREAYVNGRGGGSVRGQVDGQGYGYSWGDGGYRGGGVERRSGGGYAEQRSGYGRQSFESRTERFSGGGYAYGGGGYARGGGYSYGYGGRYVPPYGAVEHGRYTGRDADGYLTWPGKR